MFLHTPDFLLKYLLWTVYLLRFLPAQVCFWWFRGCFWSSLLGIWMLICSNHSYQPGLAMPPFFFFLGWHGQSCLLEVCGTNEYTDAQVGDAEGLFKSLNPAPCGVHPVYLISVPVTVWLSHPVPAYFDQCSSSSLLHPRTIDPHWDFCSARTHLHWDFCSARTHLHSLLIYLNGRYFFAIYCAFVLCVCVYFDCIFCSVTGILVRKSLAPGLQFSLKIMFERNGPFWKLWSRWLKMK